MNKKIFRILFGIILFVCFAVGLVKTSNAAEIIIIDTATCRTGGSLSSSPCGSDSCPTACTSVGGGTCWDDVRSDMSGWNYYLVGQAKRYIVDGWGGSWDVYFYSEQNASVKVCSIADKECGSTGSCSNTPRLWSGTCTCGIGGQYKVCCHLADASNPTTTTRSEVNSEDYYEQDGYNPKEADCHSDNGYIHAGSAYETVFGSSCPNPPTVSITVNGTAVTKGAGIDASIPGIKANVGEAMVISWGAKTGADNCTANITGAEGTGAGSYTYTPFPNSVPQGTLGEDLWIRCTNDYRGYSRYNGGDSKTVSVVNDFHFKFESGTPTCPVILVKDATHATCDSYNVSPKLPDGTTDYKNITKVVTAADTSKYAPITATQLCCERPKCSKCSTDRPGKFADWTAPSGTGEWATVAYTPATGEDVRCALSCRIEDWRINPTTVARGGRTEISWRASASDPSKDSLTRCEMTQTPPGTKTNENFTTTDKEYGPLTQDTQFDLTCTTQKGNTCSAGGPTAASAGGGLVTIGCSVNSFKPSSQTEDPTNTYSSSVTPVNLAWTTTDAGTCNINGNTVNKNSSGNYSLVDGANTFKLSCTAASNPSAICEKTITVNKTPGSCTINSFSASPTTVNSCGGSTSLSWNVSGASSCSLSGGGYNYTGLSGSGSRSVQIYQPTTFTLSCNSGSCSSQVSVGSNCTNVVNYPGSGLTASVTPNDYCYPNSGNTTNTANTVRYTASANNICSNIIGGGSQSNTSVSCSATKGDATWQSRVTGSSGNVSIPSISSTTTYGISCMRQPFICTRSDLTYETSGECSSAATSWRADPNVASANCSSYCDYSQSGSNCAVCTGGWYTVHRTCSSCSGTPPNRSCSSYDCSYERCRSWTRYDLDYRLTITSKSVITQPGTAENYVKYIQKPGTPVIDLGASIQKKTGYYQILLNQFFDILITLTAPTSSNPDITVTTKLICDATVRSGGDNTAWNNTNMTLVNKSGAINENKRSVRNNWKTLFGLTDYYSPTRSTIYQLFCKNQENTDNACYNNANDTAQTEVKVYTPDLQEKGPSAFDGFKSFIGNIFSGAKK